MGEIMDKYREIYDYILNTRVFGDTEYLFLISHCDDALVDNVLNEIVNDKSIFLEICKKIDFKRQQHVVIERVLLARIKVIKDEISKLASQCGVDIGKINLLYDQVVYISRNITDRDVCNEINSLYQEFTIIRDKIWYYYLPLLNEVLDKYKDDLKYDDIYQESALALMTVIEKFGDNNYDFKEYAMDYVRYCINYHYHDLDLCLQVPMVRRHKYYKMDKLINEYVNKHKKMPTKEELSSMLKLPVSAIISMLAVDIFDADSLTNHTLVDDEYIKNEEIFDDNADIRQVENMALDINLVSLIQELFGKLNKKEKMVIYDYYLAKKKLRNDEIAKKMGVSYGTVMNIKRRALAKLQRYKSELGEYLR